MEKTRKDLEELLLFIANERTTQLGKISSELLNRSGASKPKAHSRTQVRYKLEPLYLPQHNFCDMQISTAQVNTGYEEG